MISVITSITTILLILSVTIFQSRQPRRHVMRLHAPPPVSYTHLDTSETASLSSAKDHIFALSTEVVSSITTNLIDSLESSIQVPISTAYGTTSFRNNTSSPQYLVSNCTSSVQSNITIDRGLLSTLKTFTTSQVPTIEPSTTKLTTPLSTTLPQPLHRKYTPYSPARTQFISSMTKNTNLQSDRQHLTLTFPKHLCFKNQILR